jgi:hypothetical protein
MKNVKKLNPEIIRKRIKFHSPHAYIQEAYRYFANAKERLKDAPIQHNRYQDVKPMREACGTCYLAVLLAIDGYLLRRGVSPDQLPTTTEGYWAAIENHIPINGKLTNAFFIAYENLHIFGYYRGGSSTDMVKAGFQNAKLVIDTLAKSLPHQ